ncbi:MAG: ribosome small subunit-dependent GTPase A [Ignavibacterium sp.]|nr:MAG: ribosome small subunit-dependent GTPase A [Ignavibacterium sp.]
MILEDLGYNATFESYRNHEKLYSFDVGRVIAEHKERYIVSNSVNEFDAEVIGKILFAAKSRFDFPAVGDWVAFTIHDENKALIHSIFPRKTFISREEVGKFGEKQIIAANIDCAIIVQAVDRDFNINRLERYLSISYSANVEPVIVLSKIDLIDELKLEELINRIKKRIQNVPIIIISNETKAGYENLHNYLEKGKTFCLLGSSGVGKSTLINNLLGKTKMKTDTISLSTKKGKHVTSHRELIVLENGGILIDNPGMREVGVADTTNGLENVFYDIDQLASQCKFTDCTHTHEKGCAVLIAVENSEVEKSSYENYLKMKREKNRFQLSVAEKRKKDKEFGKMIKEVKKLKKDGKF